MKMLPPGQRSLDLSTHGSQPAPMPAAYLLSDQNAEDAASLPAFSSYLWRGKWVLAAAAVAGIAAGLLVSRMMQPVYRAHTSLQLEGFNDSGSQLPLAQGLPNASPEDYLQNEVKVLESDTLSRRVGSDLGDAIPVPSSEPGLVARASSFLGLSRPPVENAEQARTRHIKQALTVRTSLQSQVIDVFFDAQNPRVAAQGANAAATEFINMNREVRDALIQNTTEWLNRQSDELRGRLEGANRRLQDFADRNGLVFDGPQSTPEQDRLRQLQDALTRAESDRAAKEARYDAVLKNPDAVASDTSSPLRQYQEDLGKLRDQLADLKAIYTPDNPKVTRVEAQVAESNAAIEKERQHLIGQVHGEYIAALALEHTLSESLSRSMSQVAQQSDKERRYDVLKNDLQTTQALYNSVLEKAKDAGAASSLRMTNVQVIDAATPPTELYSPNLPLNLAIGLGFGLVGGFGLVLLGTRSTKVNRPGELMLMRLPELGAVPSVRDVKDLEAPSREVSIAGGRRGETQNSLLRESFRSVLTSILLSTRLDRRSSRARGQLLVVSSLEMMEGKTTIVTNLGIASAERRREVLLIDADLRRPKLHERFQLPNSYGLVDLLDRADIADLPDHSVMELIQPTQIPHLWVLTSGITQSSSPDRLCGANLDAVLKCLERRFDLVLIDTPPMSMYSDARVLGRMAEGVVMVVRANRRSRDELRSAYQKLVHERIPVIGTILNDWNIGSRQARAYNKYYNHYQQST